MVVDGPVVVQTGAGSLPQSQWPRSSSTTAVHCQGWFFWFSAVRAVFPLVVARPVMFGIMAGMDPEEHVFRWFTTTTTTTTTQGVSLKSNSFARVA